MNKSPILGRNPSLAKRLLRSRTSVHSAVLSAALASSAFSVPAWANEPVNAVNNALLVSIRATSATTPPPKQARAISMVGIAMFDAVNAASGSAYKPYSYQGGAVNGLSQDAVALSSGYNMMARLFPQLSVTLLAELDSKLNALSLDDAQRARSLAFGQLVANDLFTSRVDDGSASAQVAYVAGSQLGAFTPVQPSNPVLPLWGNVDTFGVTSSEQFGVSAPPAIGSAEWIASFNEVKALGCATCGTPEQQTIAKFWADGGGTITPPGHWLQIANELTVNLSTMEAARLTAIVGASVADAGITAWNTKYTENVWRPITAIQNCTEATCGVAGDPNWTPFLATPNFPSYTSGHSTFSGSAAGALSSFFSDDNIAFCVQADPKSGVTGVRCFGSFSEAADEAGYSRILGGIHYEFDDARAIAAGKGIGAYITANYFGLNGADTYTGYDGVISGSRGLTIVAGAEKLSGTNTYTGRTNISGLASLALLGTGSISSSDGVTVQGAFDISATAAGTSIRSLSGAGTVKLGGKQLIVSNAADTFSGVLSGTGSLNVAGGAMTLAGVNTYTGQTTVSAGRLNVTGSIANSATAILSGADLSGTGTVGSLSLLSGGGVSPGAPGGGTGSLTVNGSLSLAPGSTFAADVSPTISDRIIVRGAADLGGTLAIRATAGSYLFNTSYTLLSSDTVSRSFSASTGLSSFGVAFNPVVQNTGTAITLVLRPASLTTLLGLNAGSNSQEVAGAFDRAVNAGYNPQPFYSLYTQGSNLGSGLSQLSAEVHSAERRVALEDTRIVRETALDRINSEANSVAGTQTSTVSAGEKETTSWYRAVGNWGTAKADNRGTEFKTEKQGVLTGIDVAMANGVKLGAMFTYTRTDINFETLGQSQVKSTGGAVFAGFKTGFANFGIGGSLVGTKMNATRSISIPGLAQSLRSNASGNTYQLFGEAGYDVKVNARTTITPFGRIAYASAKASAFEETGGIAAMSGLDQRYDITTTDLGVRGAVDAGAAMITGSAAWQRIGGDRAIGSLLNIDGLNQTAHIYSTALDKNAAALEGRVSFAVSKNVAFALSYGGTVAKRNSSDEARATLTIDW